MEGPELGWEQHCWHPLPIQTLLGVLESLGFLARERGEGQRVPRRTWSQGSEGTRSGGMSQLPMVQTCTPIAVTSCTPCRPCTRVCAVVLGGRKMVALSPLGDPEIGRAHV